ncbi:uncharacterized protein LOC132023738 [Mustela nigripes]|uniref:uncharacterized protein LOC132023738 n=1 Tax=Mustela nigripes TaxID=77151 RepID=UPI002816884E|nr:uncharacterized protein LOC132023738 [Mustela nigripes]
MPRACTGDWGCSGRKAGDFRVSLDGLGAAGGEENERASGGGAGRGRGRGQGWPGPGRSQPLHPHLCSGSRAEPGGVRAAPCHRRRGDDLTGHYLCVCFPLSGGAGPLSRRGTASVPSGGLASPRHPPGLQALSWLPVLRNPAPVRSEWRGDVERLPEARVLRPARTRCFRVRLWFPAVGDTDHRCSTEGTRQDERPVNTVLAHSYLRTFAPAAQNPAAPRTPADQAALPLAGRRQGVSASETPPRSPSLHSPPDANLTHCLRQKDGVGRPPGTSCEG